MIRLALFGLFVGCALAAPASAADWNVDIAHSRLGFVGSQSGTPFEGRFTRWTARVDFDPAKPEAGTAVVDIDMTSATTGDPQKDASLPEEDWFDVKAFPTARFEAKRFRATGANAFEAIGALTLRGVHKPVTLPFTLDLAGPDARAPDARAPDAHAPDAHAKGRLTLIRTDYGVGQGVWAAPVAVALEVAVTVDLLARREP